MYSPYAPSFKEIMIYFSSQVAGAISRIGSSSNRTSMGCEPGQPYKAYEVFLWAWLLMPVGLLSYTFCMYMSLSSASLASLAL